MKINTKIIEKLESPQCLIDNYLKHYSSFEGDLEEFILLENISYSDKVWIFVQLATKKQNVKFSLLCALKVLHLFENVYPDDKRIRKALETAELYLKNTDTIYTYAAANAANAANDAADSVKNNANLAAYYSAVAAASASRAAASNNASEISLAADNAANCAAKASSKNEKSYLLLMIEALKTI